MPWALMDGCSTPTLSRRPGWWTLWGPGTPSTLQSSSASPRVSTPAGGTRLGPAPAQKARLTWPRVAPPGKSMQEALRFGCQVAGKKCGLQGFDGIV